MNKIINKFLLTVNKLMPEQHLKKPRFKYSACGPFIKHRKRIQKFREAGNSKHICRNKLDKASDSKDCAKRIILDKILKDKAYGLTRNCPYDGYQGALASVVSNFFV